MSTLIPRQAAPRVRDFRRKLRLGALALALAGLIGGGASTPVWADQDHHGGHERHAAHDRDWRGHDWGERGWRGHAWQAHHRYVYAAPGYYAYEPPPVVYVPPPPPPSINLVFPLGRW